MDAGRKGNEMQAERTIRVTSPGMFLAEDGAVYRVVLSQAKRLYAKRLNERGGFEYASSAIHRLDESQRMTLEQAQAFGRRYGVCAWCGRDLTDPASIAAGIGPVCAKGEGGQWSSSERDAAKLALDWDAVTEQMREARRPLVEANKAATPEPEPEAAPAGTLAIAEDGKTAVLVSGYDPAAVDACRSIPGRKWDAAAKTNVFKVNTTTVPMLRQLADQFGYEIVGAFPDVEAVLAQRAANVEASRQTDADVAIDGLGGELLPFQRAGVAYAAANPSTLLADEMGLGKTVQALATLEATDSFPALVIVPAVVKLNWQRETAKWLPGRRVAVLSGRPSAECVDELVSLRRLHDQVGPHSLEECEQVFAAADVPPKDRVVDASALGVDAPADPAEPVDQLGIGVRDVESVVPARVPEASLAVDDSGQVREIGRGGRQAQRRPRPVPSWTIEATTLAPVVHGALRNADGSRSRRVRGSLSEELRSLLHAEITILNYDITHAWTPFLRAVGFAAMVADESHMLKNGKAQRTKAVASIARKIDRVEFLTGTPLLNRPIELLSQLSILGVLDDFGGPMGFRNRYCDPSYNGYAWDYKGASNVEELHERLRTVCMIRRLKEQVLTELPAKRRAPVLLPLSDRAAYERVEADLREFLADKLSRDADFAAILADLDPDEAAQVAAAELERRERKAAQAEILTRINALRQTTARLKIDAAIEWIRDFTDSGKKLVVFAHHREIVEGLMAALAAAKIGAVKLTGETAAEARQAAVDRFQTDDAVRVFVGNIAAAGVGITLTAASDVAFVELPWRPGDVDQAEDRCHRIGQHDSVTAWYLLAERTMDETMAALIDEKRGVIEGVTDGREVATTSIMAGLLAALTNGVADAA